MSKITLIAILTFGLEAVVKREIQALGFEQVRVSTGRVEFEALLEDIPLANLWLRSADRVLLKMGEYESAIHSLHQAMEFYPEHSDLEYRLAGMYYMIADNLKGDFHLRNALEHNYEDHETIEVLFPAVYKQPTVKKLISSFREA